MFIHTFRLVFVSHTGILRMCCLILEHPVFVTQYVIQSAPLLTECNVASGPAVWTMPAIVLKS